METQKIALLGPTTAIGQQILKEALNRGHKVTAFTEDPKKISTSHPNLKIISGDIKNKNDIGSKMKGHDIIISAYEIKSSPSEHLKTTKNLIDIANTDDIRQIIIMGHPGAPERDTSVPAPKSAEDWKAIAEAQRQVKESLEDTKDIRWSYVHYPEIEMTTSSNKRQFGDKVLIKSSESEHWVPLKDYSREVINEAEHFTAAHTEL